MDDFGRPHLNPESNQVYPLVDLELQAIATCMRGLEPLTDVQRASALSYLMRRYAAALVDKKVEFK